MNDSFFAPTVIRASYRPTATHNACLFIIGYTICGIYLLTARKRTRDFKLIQNSVTYTVQAVALLTLPQCLFYMFIAIFIGQDLPIWVGSCSFIKHYASNAAQAASVVPPIIALCRYLQLIWMFKLGRAYISLFIGLMSAPLIGLATAYTFFGLPYASDICGELLFYQIGSADRDSWYLNVPTLVQLYLIILQPLGIAFQLYNLYYIRRYLKARDLRSIHLVEYRATVGMIWHLIVILLFLLLKFAKALAILFPNSPLQSGAVFKIIDLLPHTMPGWIGLISMLCVADSHNAIFSLFSKFRGFQRLGRIDSSTGAYLYLMDPRFFSSTVLLSSYNATATHNGSLLTLGHIVCVLYLLSTRARTDQIKRLQNNVTYTVQAVLLLTLPQCLFYLFIAIFVRTDFPIPIGACSFLKHFASYSAQVSYLAPSGIAICHHLHLVWMYNPDRVHIALFIALMGIPQIGLAIAFTFFGIPNANDTCAQLNLYQNPSVTWSTQFYLLFIQPVGIGLQMYNHFYLRRLLRKKNYDRKNHAKYLSEYHATHIMIGHLTVMLVAISLKFSFVILTKYTYVQSGALLKIIDLIPYTMPGWIGLISILGISDSHSAIVSYFRCRGTQRKLRAQSANTLSITM